MSTKKTSLLLMNLTYMQFNSSTHACFMVKTKKSEEGFAIGDLGGSMASILEGHRE